MPIENARPVTGPVTAPVTAAPVTVPAVAPAPTVSADARLPPDAAMNMPAQPLRPVTSRAGRIRALFAPFGQTG